MKSLTQVLKLIREEELSDYHVSHPENGLWVKDLEGKYISCNQFVSQRMMGVEDNKDMVGLTDYELPWKSAAPMLRKNDQRVTTENKPMLFFENDITLYDNTMLNFLSHKHPVYANEQVVGTFGISFVLPPGGAVFDQKGKFLSMLNSHHASQSGQLKLSKRQAECLKFLVRGMTVKQIALELGLSPKTVEHYIDALKAKLNCKSRLELVEKAYQMGMIGYF